MDNGVKQHNLVGSSFGITDGEIYDVCHWDSFRWHDIYTKFHDKWFTH
jgi:hypothetical protein